MSTQWPYANCSRRLRTTRRARLATSRRYGVTLRAFGAPISPPTWRPRRVPWPGCTQAPLGHAPRARCNRARCAPSNSPRDPVNRRLHSQGGSSRRNPLSHAQTGRPAAIRPSTPALTCAPRKSELDPPWRLARLPHPRVDACGPSACRGRPYPVPRHGLAGS